ncbi:hypothetical protein ACFO0N_04315 [Halobium salinum]|uniref:Transmembrane protein n=1 Tax=Halobium salinum TaxID=1364940 RepID=A0ABD5P914_9EURY|nr:hypothetical protein [Halobium salinum]
MGLKRWGMVLFGVGLLASSLWYVYPLGVCSLASYPDVGPTATLTGFDPSTFFVLYAEGETRCGSPLATVFGALLVLGVVVGGAGVARDVLNED